MIGMLGAFGFLSIVSSSFLYKIFKVKVTNHLQQQDNSWYYDGIEQIGHTAHGIVIMFFGIRR
tara:strand:+ start:5078 stop:5266 length:189 start_codon:yes stop_codon:yes gene_type:complete